MEKLLYFCTRFREGSRFIKIDENFFEKSFGSSEKSCNFAPAFKKGVKFKKQTEKIFEKRFGQLKKRLYLCTRKNNGQANETKKNFLKKDLVVSKKGFTFAPA
ncbi:hypothetical protein HMPREF1551_02697, partial [Capnocytophaga sp. oral taxon 863 str. F0517]|uniref:hypothetical protein n=1 Tax=Capnocytophaga sp. oral taxon 863 TaxID=1227265 RepID=UPI0003982196